MAEKCAEIKKNGERCGAWALAGRELCAGHSGLGTLDPVHAGRVSAQKRRERAEERKVVRERSYADHVAHALAQHAEEIVQAFLRAGLKDGDWRALEALVTRHLGRPVERTEVVTEGVDLRSLTDLELQALKRKLMDQQARSA